MGISNVDFEEKNFLELFLAITVLNNEDIVVKQEEMEKKLYKYIEDFKYRFLFINIDFDDNSKTVDLDFAFKYSLSFGLINYLDEKKEKNIINLTEYQAKERLKKYNEYQIKAMNDICSDYYKTNDNVKLKVKNNY